MDRSIKMSMFFCLVLMATCSMLAMATMEQDEKDCADQLTNLAACIPFVSGTSKKPTPECCEDTKKVRAAKPKCLCVLIKESADPSLGLPINTTLAMQMPSACNIDAKPSDCPSILNLPADSPEAKIFKTADDSNTTSTTTNSPPTSTSTSSGASDSKTTSSSNNGANLCQTILVIMGLASTMLIFI